MVSTAWLTSCLHRCNTMEVPGVWSCGNSQQHLLTQMRFSLVGWQICNFYMFFMTLIVVNCTAQTCRSASTHVHTQIHTHTDFLLRVSVYVGVLELQGFGMPLDPGLRETQGQACHRMWGGCGARAFSFSHRPWDAHRTHNTHSC